MSATTKAPSEDSETLSDPRDRKSNSPRAIAVPYLFVVIECSRPEADSSRHSLSDVDHVRIGRSLTRCANRTFEDKRWILTIGVPDPRMSSHHARITREGEEWLLEDVGSRNGTRLNGRRITAPTSIGGGDLLECGQTIMRYVAAVETPLGTPRDWPSEGHGILGDGVDALATTDPSLSDSFAALARVARSASTVLLLGETGTGKEVAARTIHRLSGRKGEFIATNCGAFPTGLLEAQLFGHVRGAFSGAITDAPGLVRSAEGGTLLLDEIGDLPGPSQAAFLRVLQERQVVPVGGVRPVSVDVRILAATHRKLDELVSRGEFRRDLYARLANFTFALPPLRERQGDVGLMIAAFARRRPIRLTVDAGRLLLQYEWPLNIRELHSALDIGATLAGQEPIDVVHLPGVVARPDQVRGSDCSPAVPHDNVRTRLLSSLTRHRGNVSEVARDLGKARMQVQRWMKRFRIDPRDFRPK